MNKDRYQSTSARRALALLNSPQVNINIGNTLSWLNDGWAFKTDIKAGVGGAAGPGPLFLPEMVLAGPHFWPNTFLAGPFSHVSFRPTLMIYFSMIKD